MRRKWKFLEGVLLHVRYKLAEMPSTRTKFLTLNVQVLIFFPCVGVSKQYVVSSFFLQNSPRLGLGLFRYIQVHPIYLGIKFFLIIPKGYFFLTLANIIEKKHER